MIVIKIGDGLGNQLYNYACGYAAAKKTGQSLKMDISECDNSTLRDYELGHFGLDECPKESFPNKTFWQKAYKRLRRDIKYHVIKENPKTYSIFDGRVFRKKRIRDTYLHGYWQNIGYFKMYEADIRRQFKPNYPMTEPVRNLIQKFSSTNSCAIHMRGQDIKMPSEQYFGEAISIMNRERPGCAYYIFTNDKQQAIDKLSKLNVDFHFVSEYGDFSNIDDFFMMSACQNQIISDSSYSRWAALLNENPNKLVIAPGHKKNEEDYPDEWVKL